MLHSVFFALMVGSPTHPPLLARVLLPPTHHTGRCPAPPPHPPPPPTGSPLSHRLDTSSRVEQPKHDWGCESAAHVRKTEASRHESVGSMRMHGVEMKWYAPHAVQQ